MTDIQSETVSKKDGRGRPRLPIGPELKALFPDVETERGLQNKFFGVVAIGALGGQEASRRYPWFAGEGRRNFREGILAEIGRTAWMFGNAVAEHVAGELLELYPNGTGANTRKIAELLRFHRQAMTHEVGGAV